MILKCWYFSDFLLLPYFRAATTFFFFRLLERMEGNFGFLAVKKGELQGKPGILMVVYLFIYLFVFKHMQFTRKNPKLLEQLPNMILNWHCRKWSCVFSAHLCMPWKWKRRKSSVVCHCKKPCWWCIFFPWMEFLFPREWGRHEDLSMKRSVVAHPEFPFYWHGKMKPSSRDLKVPIF